MGQTNVSIDAGFAEGVAEPLPAHHPTRVERFRAVGQLDVFRTRRAPGISGNRVGDGSDVPPLNGIAGIYSDFRRNEPQLVVQFDDYDVYRPRCLCCLLGAFRTLSAHVRPQDHRDPENRLKSDDCGNCYACKSTHSIIVFRKDRYHPRQPVVLPIKVDDCGNCHACKSTRSCTSLEHFGRIGRESPAQPF